MELFVCLQQSICRSAIRIRGLPEYVVVDTPQIIHCTEVRSFWISWRHGTIEVGRGLQVGWNSFMAYQPLELYDVVAVGYSTGFGHEGTWIMTTDDSKPIAMITVDEWKFSSIKARA
jgi:Farnesoic acid 0-methyl transferase